MQLYLYEQQHVEILRKAAPECMVLLKSDGSFPLKNPGKIALYGSGARNTIKGGTGSGDVNVRHFTTIEEGLESAGFTITTKAWLDTYEEVRRQAHQSFVKEIKEKAKEKGVPAILLGMGAVMPEPEYEIPLEKDGGTAIYVLARISGEGADREEVCGDFRLTETEVRDILALSGRYEKFLLVLNTGGVVDLSPVMEVKNILLLSQTGMTIGDSFVDVLLGKSYPSGKLASTWTGQKNDRLPGDFGGQDDTRYREGIYVGYRYFDTVDQAPLFPFGYGLGYTTFTIKEPEVFLDKTEVTVKVIVENTGTAPGKEVVQLYVSVPSGKLDQPYQTLAAFAKTRELKPGETQEAVLSFSLEEISSFDTRQSAEILEAGDYVLRVGNSSRNTTVCGVVHLDDEIIVSRLMHVGGEPEFEDWKPEPAVLEHTRERDALDEKIRKNKIPVLTLKADSCQVPDAKEVENEERTKDCTTKCVGLTGKSAAEDEELLEETAGEAEELLKLLDTMSDSELAYLCIGGYQEEGSKSVIGNAGFAVAGSAGETTRRYEAQGIPALVMADGPAGLRLSRQYGVDEQGIYAVGDTVPAAFLDYIDEQVLALFGKDKEEAPRTGKIYDQYCSAIPVGTALAQSWNVELCEVCADLVGSEMERFKVHLWLAPALNIHRSPLCGRNFEYYSEDPLVSGKMAAAITRGVQKHPGCGVTIKHFVCNNQETNRFHSNSIVSERALRDLYMRGFQIAVKEAQPHAVMTSYNLLNGEHTSQRADIIKQVLRREWGFKGIVMSDWVTPGIPTGQTYKYPYACASGSIKAGNDIMMPGGAGDHTDLMEALSNPEHPYPITREDLKECAYRVASMARKLQGE